jgi:hypothetical protein
VAVVALAAAATKDWSKLDSEPHACAFLSPVIILYHRYLANFNQPILESVKTQHLAFNVLKV